MNEDLKGKFQYFPESYLNKFGRKIRKSEIIEHFNNVIKQKHEQQLRSVFENISPQDLMTAIESLKSYNSPFIEDDLRPSSDVGQIAAKMSFDYKEQEKTWFKGKRK